MNFAARFFSLLPQFDRRLWLLMVGRLLSQLGTGFVLFYAAIFFVNQVGLSAPAVGFGIGSESISGAIGRVLGGTLADSPHWGRRKILLISAAISAAADLVLALSYDFPTFLIGNLLMGLGIGLYWPATEAVIADLATLEQRNEAFALNRLADNIGLGLGVVLGGWLIAATGAYRAMFVIDGISFVIFFAVIYRTISETLVATQGRSSVVRGWLVALRDRPLFIFVLANIGFTTYLALINTALPLYLTGFISATPSQTFTPQVLSLLFGWYVVLCVLGQLPVVRLLHRFSNSHTLMMASGLWAFGFGLIWYVGQAAGAYAIWAGLALAVMAIATVTYNPAASSLVVQLAPESLRGVYLSINSLCWAAGYFIGPTIGGWAMGENRPVANGFWIAVVASTGGVILVLQILDRRLRQSRSTHASNISRSAK